MYGKKVLCMSVFDCLFHVAPYIVFVVFFFSVLSYVFILFYNYFIFQKKM